LTAAKQLIYIKTQQFLCVYFRALTSADGTQKLRLFNRRFK